MFSIFLPLELEWQSCLHILISFLLLLEPNQNMSYLSAYHRPVPNCAKFHDNVENLRKQANSAARLKIPRKIVPNAQDKAHWRAEM